MQEEVIFTNVWGPLEPEVESCRTGNIYRLTEANESDERKLFIQLADKQGTL